MCELKHILKTTAVLVLGLNLAWVRHAQATAEVQSFPFLTFDQLELNATFAPPISPSERFMRAEAVFNYFAVPPQVEPTAILRELDGLATAASIRARLPFLDGKRQFARFFSKTGSELVAFRDRDALQVPEFLLNLRPPSAPAPPQAFMRHLQAAAQSVGVLPLQGLKIALDPGHMGGKFWDDLTGKYIRKKSTGAILSEGVLAMQTSLLVARALETQGAEILITRDGIRPASGLPYAALDVKDYGRRELRFVALQEWFQKLLTVAAPSTSLYRAFENNRQFQQLSADNARAFYYISREDLEARAQKIDAFRPDITLIIHYDVATPANDPHGIDVTNKNFTKAYVPGGFLETEFASSAERANFVYHLATPDSWDASVRLSQRVVAAMGSRLGIQPDPDGGPGSPVRVSPGVYSRNLMLTRRLTAHAVAYLETMYYTPAKDFDAMAQPAHPMWIEGVNYPYSDRVAQVADAIQAATLSFVASYR